MIAVSESARKNDDGLFPGHVSSLAVTDPELIEYFDNFVFDEVLLEGGLETERKANATPHMAHHRRE